LSAHIGIVPWDRIILAIAANYAGAIGAWGLLGIRRREIRFPLTLAVGLPTVFAAVLIPLDLPVIGAGVAILGIITASRIATKAIDGNRPALSDYLRYISVAMLRPHLHYVANLRRTRPRVAREILRLAVAAAIIPPAWYLARRLNWSDAAQQSWLVSHLIVAAGFTVIMTCTGQCLLAVWRLQGLHVRRPIVDNILASRTPADFWRRWSWPPHAGLNRYIYIPAGGPRHHIRATMAAFAASALAHEVLAAVAIGRATGHQTLFFLLSGIGVIASPALERLGRRGLPGQILMRTLTLTFLVASASLFFATVNYVLPIYMKHIWLMW
jgi:hypothetical protein